MIFAGEFFSGDYLRWNLGWPTPNYAGALVVTLVVLLWVFSPSRWRWALFVVEIGGLFLLAKTYSRGAVVAWLVAWGFGVITSHGWRYRSERLVWGVRLGALIVILLGTGFDWSRARTDGIVASTQFERDRNNVQISGDVAEKDQNNMEVDGSVVNRLALWQGGFKMIVAAPWSGWGTGESGRAYMNWYQDIDRSEGYTTMVNSFLHIAVEHGLPVLGVVLFLLSWLLLGAWRGTGKDGHVEASEGSPEFGTRTIDRAAGASLVAWAVANVFTTLWIEPRLWVVPLVAMGWLFYSISKQPRHYLGQGAAWAVGVSILVVVGLYFTGTWLNRDSSYSLHPSPSCCEVEVHKKSRVPVSSAVIWQVWSDREVLGAYPGKELRRWVEGEFSAMTIKVATGWDRGTAPSLGGRVLLMGQQAERLGSADWSQVDRLYIVHPLGSPPLEESFKSSGKPDSLRLVLPELAQDGNTPAWRRWAAEQGATITITPGVSTDIRAVWPEIVKTWEGR